MAGIGATVQEGAEPAATPRDSFPILYEDIQPLSSILHAGYRYRRTEAVPGLARTNAVPLTIEEFVAAQRHYPIVFSTGDDPVPLALMGLDEGVNTFFDAAGRPVLPVYIPAYVRRYPFILAKLEPTGDELSLCYDPTSGLIGPGAAGEALFENGQPSQALLTILTFCEDFEAAAQRTTAFARRLAALGLLIDGEVSIQPTGARAPFLYRGFRMVDEARLHALDEATRRELDETGHRPLILAHLMSMPLVREVFARQHGRPRSRRRS